MSVDQSFSQLLAELLKNGEKISTRNSEALRVVGYNVCFLETAPPLVSLRKTAWKNACREMEWFLTGSDNLNDLDPKVHHWWSPWANPDGVIPNNYGRQFRHFVGQYGEVDQIQYVIDCLANHPFSRRCVITTWNTSDMINPATPLTNCHGTLVQFFCHTNNKVDMVMYQRSCDVMLGLIHNWIQYHAFHQWLCVQSGREVGKFSWIGGDVHLYNEHIELAKRLTEIDVSNITTPILANRCEKGKPFKADDFYLIGDYKALNTEPAKLIV